MNLFKSIQNLTKIEKTIWIGSLVVIFVSSALFPSPDWVSVVTSLIGATALIFVGKGDPIGQVISIIFATLYAAVSFHTRYYGEMITYLGLTTPSAAWALVTWLRNPYSEREVKVAKMTPKKWVIIGFVAVSVTLVMWPILGYFNTANLLVSTLSVTTSFMASVLTIMRSPCYALFYAANDIVLIILWILATLTNVGYLPMVMCFVIFLVNDTYGFINWRLMKKRQEKVKV